MAPRILLADGDQTVRLILEKSLNLEGFQVVHAEDGQAVLSLLETSLPDVLVVNSWLPRVTGMDVCGRLRADAKYFRLPIILLVADPPTAGERKVADDCLSMPFPSMELATRVKILLRRVNPTVLNHMLKVGDITLDVESRRVHRRNREVMLGPTEFKLLEALMRAPSRVFKRSELMRLLWGDNQRVREQAIDVHMARLRKGINVGKVGTVIRTVRGVGYSLDEFQK